MHFLKSIVFVIAVTIVHSATAQNTIGPAQEGEYIDNAPGGGENESATDDEIFFYVDELPDFNEDFRLFIAKNYNISADIYKNGKPGSLFVTFIVEKDGSLSGVKILPGKGLTPAQDAEALRVIKLSSGKWTPGKINGEPVRCSFKQSITFTEDMFE